jgi:hypothetical protein
VWGVVLRNSEPGCSSDFGKNPSGGRQNRFNFLERKVQTVREVESDFPILGPLQKLACRFAREHNVRTRMPASQPRGPKCVIAEKEIVHRMLLSPRSSCLMWISPPAHPRFVRQAAVTPFAFRQDHGGDFRSARHCRRKMMIGDQRLAASQRSRRFSRLIEYGSEVGTALRAVLFFAPATLVTD